MLKLALFSVRRSFYTSTQKVRFAARPIANLKQDSLRKAEQFLKSTSNSSKFNEIGRELDISHYNALLQSYLEMRVEFDPSQFLQDLSNKGIEANRVTYQKLIARYCEVGDLSGASKILQFMKDEQLPVNESVFNSLIVGHGEARDMESARGMLNVMREAGLEPNHDSYGALMRGYAKAGNIVEIDNVMKEMNEMELFVYDRFILDCIIELARNNHNDLAIGMISKLKKHTGFNQEAKSTIVQLVHLKLPDVAFRLLSEMPIPVNAGFQFAVGNFFIKEAVSSGMSSNDLLKYCNQLIDSKLNEGALSKACEYSFHCKKFDLAFDCLEAIKSKGPLRQHYFWPFFAQSSNEKDVYYGLKCLRYLKVSPTAETLRDYIIPAVFEKAGSGGKEQALQNLSSYINVPMSFLANEAARLLVESSDFNGATELVSKYQIGLDGFGMVRSAVEGYVKSGDAKGLVKLLVASSNNEENARSQAGAVILAMVQRPMKREDLKNILTEMRDSGIGISNSGAELIKVNIKGNITPEIEKLVDELLSPGLAIRMEIVPKERNRKIMLEDNISIEELEKRLEQAVSMNNEILKNTIQRRLIFQYCRSRNLEKAEKLKGELLGQGYVFPQGLHALFLQLYCHHALVDKAKETMKFFKQGTGAIMDDVKLLQYVALLIENGEAEEALEVLKTQMRDEDHKPKGAFLQRLVMRIFRPFIENGDVEKVTEIFQTLKSRGFINMNATSLAPLVKVHLARNDLDSAVKEFEDIASTHHFAPGKFELFCKLIEKENTESLQKILDISTNLHGEINSLYDFAFALIECGKLKQAKKILDTPGFRARSDKLDYICEKFINEGKVDNLENLIKLTKDLTDVDRNSLYYYLLEAYVKADNVDKALDVWTNLQEENVEPSPLLLRKLSKFLESHNRTVPFVIPDESLEEQIPEEDRNEPKKAIIKPKGDEPTKGKFSDLRNALKMNDLDKALSLKQRLEGSGISLPFRDLSDVISSLMKAERIGEAVRVTEEMLREHKHPLIPTLKHLIGKLSVNGKVEELLRLKDLMSEELKRSTVINTRLLTSYALAGRGREYFENVLVEAVSSLPENCDVQKLSEYKVPAAGSYILLMQNPDIVEEFEKLAELANRKNNYYLYSGLWTYYMLNKNFEASRKIWKEHLKDKNRVMYMSIVRSALKSQDEEIIQELLTEVSEKELLTPTTLSHILSAAVQIKCSNDKVEEAVAIIKERDPKLDKELFTRGCLETLKEKLEGKGMQVPFELPKRRTKKNVSSSSSSSDDSDSD